MRPSFVGESTFLWTIGLQFAWSDMSSENSESLWLEICIVCRKMCQQTDSKFSRKICSFVVFQDTLESLENILSKISQGEETYLDVLQCPLLCFHHIGFVLNYQAEATVNYYDEKGWLIYRLHHLLFWILKALKVTNEDWLFSKNNNNNSYKQDFRQAGLAGFTS